MRHVLLILPLILAACGNQYQPPSRAGTEAPMVVILRNGGVETTLRGSVRPNPDGSAAFDVASTGGATCDGLFGANGNGIFTCSDGLSVSVSVPNEVYGQPSGAGVVAAGSARIGFGWGEDASVDTVRALF